MIKNKFLPSKISKDQAKDTGMAVVLLLLLSGVLLQNNIYVKIGIFCLLIVMTFPLFYKYIAVFWLGLSHILGTFASKIILSVLFFLVVSPVGILRRLLKYDTLKLRQFKKGNQSVMYRRDCTFKKEDIDKPY